MFRNLKVIGMDHAITILLINGGPWASSGWEKLTLDGKSLASVCIIGRVLPKSIDTPEHSGQTVPFDVD